MALSKQGVRERGFRGSPVGKLTFVSKACDSPRSTVGLSQKMAGNSHPCRVLAYPVWSVWKTNKKKARNDARFSSSLSFESSSIAIVKDELTKMAQFLVDVFDVFFVHVVLANASAMCQKSSMEPLLSQATFSLPLKTKKITKQNKSPQNKHVYIDFLWMLSVINRETSNNSRRDEQC